ncbi:hypothetical protein [uncultured Winogradskyella sp.]|uniref:hypothetical protein n=1 Tax=uncultured Winogradskyella sp. TaxID=395353 RepID=UPI0030ED2997
MEQTEFLEKTRKAYLEARECSFSPKSNSSILSRGTSHSISSITEDLFGCYCAEKVAEPNGIKILIDPPISFKGTELKNKSGKKSLLLRPDIAFTKDNITNCFFDIKTDLGYKRFEFLNQARDRNNQLNTIKEKYAHYKNGKTKINQRIKISSDIKFVYVVISQGNIGQDKMENFISGIKLLENVEVFVISKGEHLNSYNEISKTEINETDFNGLDKLINEKLNE